MLSSQEYEPLQIVVLESTNLMQHTFDVVIQEEEQRLNKLKREEVIPRYKSASPPYYQGGQKNEKFENFELLIHYVVEQKVAP